MFKSYFLTFAQYPHRGHLAMALSQLWCLPICWHSDPWVLSVRTDRLMWKQWLPMLLQLVIRIRGVWRSEIPRGPLPQPLEWLYIDNLYAFSPVETTDWHWKDYCHVEVNDGLTWAGELQNVRTFSVFWLVFNTVPEMRSGVTTRIVWLPGALAFRVLSPFYWNSRATVKLSTEHSCFLQVWAIAVHWSPLSLFQLQSPRAATGSSHQPDRFWTETRVIS